jgi:AcrR family transcriptional regulator
MNERMSTTKIPVAEAPEGQATARRILDVATLLFYERGYHAVTMREIAAGVGIKAGSLYNHFPGKQEILLRIGQEATRPLYEGALARVAEREDVEEQLGALVRWHVTYHCVNRWGCRVIDSQLQALEPDYRAALVEVRDAHEQILRDILKRGQAEGRWEVDDIGVVAIAIATMCTDVATWYREDGRLAPEEVAEVYARFVRTGLGRPSKGSAQARKTSRPAGKGKAKATNKR